MIYSSPGIWRRYRPFGGAVYLPRRSRAPHVDATDADALRSRSPSGLTDVRNKKAKDMASIPVSEDEEAIRDLIFAGPCWSRPQGDRCIQRGMRHCDRSSRVRYDFRRERDIDGIMGWPADRLTERLHESFEWVAWSQVTSYTVQALGYGASLCMHGSQLKCPRTNH